MERVLNGVQFLISCPHPKPFSFSIYARKRPHHALPLQLRSWSQSWEPQCRVEMYGNDELKGSDSIREPFPQGLHGEMAEPIRKWMM